MKYIHPFLSVMVIAIFLVLAYTKNAIAEDNTCNLKSNTATLHISVYNVLPAGTIGLRIWQGIVKQDEQVLLKSKYGRIYYEYSTNPEAYSSNLMGYIRSCMDKEIFSLP